MPYNTDTFADGPKKDLVDSNNNHTVNLSQIPNENPFGYENAGYIYEESFELMPELNESKTDDKITFQTLKEISVKSWLLLWIIATTSSVYYVVFAVFPSLLQNKFKFSVIETGNIMFRTPIIEGMAKLLGVALAIKFGKRG